MQTVSYVILGAGPSGLTLAHRLIENGTPPSEVIVLEKESMPGGLCRSQIVDGAPLDIGGGHFLDVRLKQVLSFLFRFLPESEWSRFDRVAKINLRDGNVDHPLESNLWQLSKSDQIDYLESIAKAGSVSGTATPSRFEDWVKWKLGELIANEYMLPYNRKIWSMNLNDLGTYWLYKLPNVSFRDTLKSCLTESSSGSLPAHGVFLYPKNFGYGEVWKRMGDALGNSLVKNCPLKTIDLKERVVNSKWKATKIINTIPWSCWIDSVSMPEDVVGAIKQLVHVSIDVDYHQQSKQTTAHWIYEPDENIPEHRYLIRENFCRNSRGFWTETNAKRSKAPNSFRHRNEFAYPVNTENKLELMSKIKNWCDGQNIICAGRWGRWEHMNSDVAVAEALALADQLKTNDPK